MKMIFFCTYYPQYWDFFYKRNKQLRHATYYEQHAAILNDFSSVWGSYTKHFRKIGVDVELVIPNCKYLQAAWAKENNMSFDRDWVYSIPMRQVKKIKPDIFFIGSMFEYYGAFLDEIKTFVPYVFGWIACPIPGNVDISKLQLIITSLPYYVDKFRDMKINSELLNSAFDRDILDHINDDSKQDIDFSFLGSFTKAHLNRIDKIKKLVEQTPLTIFGTGISEIPDNRNIFQQLFKKRLVEQRYLGEAWGLDMFQILKRSKITFNVHIDISAEYAGNMRMFEATGVGTLLLTDGKNTPSKLFEENEVVYYESIEDAIEKAQYYLAHEDERKEIADRGHQKTLTKYDFSITSKQMYEYFVKHMSL